MLAARLPYIASLLSLAALHHGPATLLVVNADTVVGGSCLNGGNWTVNAQGDWYCDCTTTEESAAHAGFQCEHSATEYCHYDPTGLQPVSKKFFCTNHGKCRDTVMDSAGAMHPGCVCQEGWEGRFCEYETGTAPGIAATGTGGGAQQTSNGQGYSPSSGARGGAIFLLVVVCLAIVLGVAFIVRGIMRNRNAARERSPTAPQEVVSAAADGGNDLALEADGSSTLPVGVRAGTVAAVPPPTDQEEGEII